MRKSGVVIFASESRQCEFDDNMNWENQNKYWQIDHRIPVKWFDLFDEEELLFCCNFKNLQPMAAQLNNDKSCSFPDNLLFS